MTDPGDRRLGTAYFLAFVAFGLALLMWLRGLGRLILPVLLIGVIAYGVHRLMRKLREPVD